MSYEDFCKRFNEDAKTNKLREDIKIDLTDNEYRDLRELAYKAGFSNAGELISGFVGDLTGWLHTNGSDERDRADQWFERAFGCWTFYFRYFLFDQNYCLEQIKELAEETELFDEVYGDYKEEFEILKDRDLDQCQDKENCLKIVKEIIEDGTWKSKTGWENIINEEKA